MCCNQALPFLDDQDAIHWRVLDNVCVPAGPEQFQPVDSGRCRQAEVKPQIARREVTSSTAHLIVLSTSSANHPHLRADAVPIARVPMVSTRIEWLGFFRACRIKSGESFMLLTMISTSPSLSVVGHGETATHLLDCQTQPSAQANLLEFPVAAVVEQQVALGISDPGWIPIHLREGLAISEENILPPTLS